MRPLQTLVALLTISLFALAACGESTPEPTVALTSTPSPTIAEVTQVEVRMLSPGDNPRPPVGAARGRMARRQAAPALSPATTRGG